VTRKRMFENKDYVAIPREVWDKFCAVSPDLYTNSSWARREWTEVIALLNYSKVGFSGEKMEAILDQYVKTLEARHADEADADAKD